MINFLKALEPRFYRRDEIILRDLEEVEEIVFVLKGDVSIIYFIFY
jgi:signal-transduction protein with cAMP-binding, CBS, and nucleotidyltransferase domain